jgi:hypothetical protein
MSKAIGALRNTIQAYKRNALEWNEHVCNYWRTLEQQQNTINCIVHKLHGPWLEVISRCSEVVWRIQQSLSKC